MCVSPQKPETNFLKLDLPFETLFGNVTLCALASLNPRKNCFQVIFIEVHTLSTPETVRGMARVKLNVNKSNNMKYKYEGISNCTNTKCVLIGQEVGKGGIV